MSQTQSTSSAKRQLYSITRSEATWLMTTFMMAKKKGADGSIEPFNVFRNELETEKPAYLGKFNNSNNASVQYAFYKIANDLYNMLVELNRRVAETDHHKKTMEAAKRLPCKHSIAYLTATFLNWAVYNWYKKDEHVTEELGDNGYETNTCSVCNFTGHDVFYFSTVYGLEMPVCERCLPFDVNEYKEEKDGEYVMSEEEASEAEASDAEESEKEASEEEASEAEASDDEYHPSNESEAEQEEDELDDEYTDEESEDEADVPARVVHKRFETPSPSPNDNSSSSSRSSSSSSDDSDSDDSDYSDSDSEKSFGCSGCNYEWKAGYKYGYKTAMKEISKYTDEVKDDAPSAPRCATCNMSHESLKKCGGCKMVRYCSNQCQTDDWREHKKVCRRENLIVY